MHTEIRVQFLYRPVGQSTMGGIFYLKNLHFYLDWNCLVHTRTSHGKFYFKVIMNFASEQTLSFNDCNVLEHLNGRQNLKWECHAITNNYTSNESTLNMYQSSSIFFLPMHIHNTLIFISTDDLTCRAFANANSTLLETYCQPMSLEDIY